MDHKSKRITGKLLFVQDPKKRSPQPFRYMGAGIEIIAPAVLFMVVGHRIDRWLDSEPLAIALGAVVGLVLGLFMFLRTVIRE